MPTKFATLGQKGGGGKSTIARLLATEAARSGLRVVVVDLDVDQQTVVEWQLARDMNEVDPGVMVVSVNPNDEPDFRMGEVGTATDVLILDAPGWSDVATVSLARLVDIVVLPCQPSADDLRPTIRLHHELVSAGIPASQILLVLNRVGTAAESKSAREYLAQAGLSALEHELPDQPIYRRAGNSGLSAAEVSAAGPRDRARAVVAEIMGRATVKPRVASLRFEPLKPGETW